MEALAETRGRGVSFLWNTWWRPMAEVSYKQGLRIVVRAARGN